MYKEKEYIGGTTTELLDDLIDITDSHTEAELLLDDVISAYEIEYLEELKVIRGEKTREQLEQERENRRLGRIHSNRLRDNMIAAGRFQPSDTSVHHIVAWGDKNAEGARFILEQVGIHVDDEVNGVYLPMYKKHKPHLNMPNAYAHSETHTVAYYLNITTLLEQGEGNKSETEAILRRIGENLSKGMFPLKKKIKRLNK